MDYRILPPQELLETQVRLPLSKSISNRALIINALTVGALPLTDVAQCADTSAMIAALASSADTINVGAAGTAMRFLTAYFATMPGRTVILDGSERMRQRPIGPLVEALRSCGASIEYAGQEGYPPLKITGKTLTGGEIAITGSVSSQYISALLMIAPTMKEGLKITIEGDIISRPYIAMTLTLMRHWGVEADFTGNVVTVPCSPYAPTSFAVEADWSAASYWYEIQALTSGWVTLDGLRQDSCQGDSQAAKIFEQLGVTTDFEPDEGDVALMASPDLTPRLVIDMAGTPDLAQTVVVTAAMLRIPFRITGLASLRIKETDRLTALHNELLKIGVVTEIENSDSISWDGTLRPIYTMPEFDTYDDHRMAMAFAPVAIYIPGIVIRNVEVVEKSYPGFWDDLRNAGFTLLDPAQPIPQPTGEGDGQ